MNTAIKVLLATVIGTMALYTQGYELPKRFVSGAENRGEAVIEAGFIGLEWDCAPNSKRINETCWAGLTDDGFVTGP